MKRAYLRACREFRGMPRSAAAQEAGISEIHLRKLEDGQVNPSVNVMRALCILYEETPQKLFPDLFEGILYSDKDSIPCNV
ncbi:helix-turn-helix domain-containing protein [Paenibacillus alvei]|uniref:helix-turn-helix domain-containing protein n=1 Tax=Paenibacillus alvei TaxID=44250 RepID=UPI0013DC6479|nr:helix-turn-helix domain-containing protein [Paenibacillus alvei]NEZ44522.1 helix-turn-helix domain-containing protein [Paenibacillus alvei]